MSKKMTGKKVLSKEQEFDILKLVLDKFLWLGLIIMLYGFYLMVAHLNIITGLAVLIAGAIILVLFMIILIKEYEFLEWNRK